MSHNLFIIITFKTHLWLSRPPQNIFLSVSRKKVWFNTALLQGGDLSFIYPQYFGKHIVPIDVGQKLVLCLKYAVSFSGPIFGLWAISITPMCKLDFTEHL